MIDTNGSGKIDVHWVRTTEPQLEYSNALCPTKKPLIWEYQDELYLVPFSVIKNARRIYQTRRAHEQVYKTGLNLKPLIVLLDQAVQLHLKAHHFSYESTENLWEHDDLDHNQNDPESDTP